MYGRSHQEITDDARRRPQQAIYHWSEGSNGWSQLYGRTCPALDTTLLDTEDEDRTTLDHCASLIVVQSASDAWDDSLSGGMDEAESINGCLDVADEGGDVWVAAHGNLKLEVVGQM